MLFQNNTNAPSHARQYCIASMGDKWRNWKSRMKGKGYYAYEIDEKRLANCPVGVLENQWCSLVSMWEREDIYVSVCVLNTILLYFV